MKKNHQYALTASLILCLGFTICLAANKVHSGTMRKYSRYVMPTSGIRMQTPVQRTPAKC